MLFAQINTKEMLMFEDYFDPDDDYDDDGYDEDNGFGDDGDDDEDDYDDYGDAGDDGGNGGGKSDKGADNDESGYGDDTGDGFGEDQTQQQDPLDDQTADRREGDANIDAETKWDKPDENPQRERENKINEADVKGKAEGGPKGKAAEEKLAKKNATRWSSLLGIPVGIRAVGTCPGCGKKTIYQSMTAIDLIIFKAILSLTKSPLNVYFCMNSGKNCRLSFEKGMCWMCAGKFEPTTMPVPYPLKLFRFNK